MRILFANVLCAVAFLLSHLPAQADEDLTVLPPDFDGPGMMLDWIHARTFTALDRRLEEYEKLETIEQIAEWQRVRREFFLERIGEFPERTPLNARVVGRLAGNGFRIERVIYDSQPAHHVTGLMYLPDSKGPHAAVIVPCGHSANGKAWAEYQHLGMAHAVNGIAALVYDPIGQGERYQILDEEGKPPYRATDEHTLVGTCAIPLGWNAARFRIWDGIRSIDYLCSRDDIDPQRIGCTGNSGGGTLTKYLMWIDPRIRCAAPASSVTTFRRLATRGPGDAEQNIFGQIGFGFAHGDYTILQAPRPLLLLTGTRDYIEIGGSWVIFRETARVYARLGHPERIDLVEVDEEHGFQKPLREATVAWMHRWLNARDGTVVEPEWTPFPDREVQCTPRGQVMLMEGARSVHDLMAVEDDRLRGVRAKFLKESSPAEIRQSVRELAGIRQLDDLPEAAIENVGTVQRNGYGIRKLVLRPEEGIRLPALQFLPGRSQGDLYLYLHDRGKQTGAAPGGPIEKLVRQGHTVLAVDLRGLGETRSPNTFQVMFKSYLVGDTYVGMRAEDALIVARRLASMDETGSLGNSGERARASRKVHVIAFGEAGPPALHAVALEPELFGSLKLTGSLVSWSDVVRTPVPRNQLIQVVHGTLRKYDLPDLAGLLPEGFVTIEAPRRADGRPAGNPAAP